MHKTLVIGASLNPQRYSNMAIKMLVEYKHEVKAIGLKKGKISGVEVELEIGKVRNQFHTITLYLNPLNQRPFYPIILEINPKRVIFNPGTENEELQNLLDKAGIHWEESCTLVLLRTGQY